MFQISPMLWVAATRPAFLSVTFVGVLLGLATAHYDGTFRSSWLAGLTLILAVLAHAGANVLNDYYDALSGCDEANVDRIFPYTGGSRFIQDGIISKRQTAIYGYALLLSVIPAGLYLVSYCGSGLLIIGLCGLLAGWAYSATPLKLQSRGIGELTITVVWTMIVIGSDYVQRGQFALTPLISGFAYALLVANMLFINQIPDFKADAAAKKNTLIVILGAQLAPWITLALYIAATGTLLFGIALKDLPLQSVLALLFLTPASLGLRGIFRMENDRETLTTVIRMTILSCLTFGVLLVGALLS